MGERASVASGVDAKRRGGGNVGVAGRWTAHCHAPIPRRVCVCVRVCVRVRVRVRVCLLCVLVRACVRGGRETAQRHAPISCIARNVSACVRRACVCVRERESAHAFVHAYLCADKGAS